MVSPGIFRFGGRGDTGPGHAIASGATIRSPVRRDRAMPVSMVFDVVEISRFHLAESADCDRDMRIGRGAQLIEEIDVRNFPPKFVLSSHIGAAAAC